MNKQEFIQAIEGMGFSINSPRFPFSDYYIKGKIRIGVNQCTNAICIYFYDDKQSYFESGDFKTALTFLRVFKFNMEEL